MATEPRPLYENGEALPGAIVAAAEHQVDLFGERAGDDRARWLAGRLDDGDFRNQLTLVWGASEFVAKACVAHPDTFVELVESGDLWRPMDVEALAGLAERLSAVAGEKDLHRTLRQFRRREMVRLVWRDFTRQAVMEDTTREVSLLAETVLDQTLDFLYRQLCESLGTPIGRESGESQRLVVLGMGKLGARELNLSSDIDLIFAFAEAGETRGGKRELSNQEFFVRLGQKLIQALDSNTVDSFVFRVDMRLRPYGQSGALALGFDAMEEYYHNQGRDWERYAMIKARVVAGDKEAGADLMAILRPFTYRKYIDFSAIQSLRDMKALINREVKRTGAERDIKKGAGGIREVEFVAQAFQLIRGGKDPGFQQTELKSVLRLLDDERLLPEGKAEALWQAYLFLRNTEHVLQGMGDQQTQSLPAGEEDQAVVAAVMGFPGWEAFLAELDRHRQAVRDVFAEVASEPVQEREEPEAIREARASWQAEADADHLAEELADMGYEAAREAAEALLALRESRAVAAMAASIRDRLDTFMPRLIASCARRDNAAQTLIRILPLVQGVVRRSAYLVLLIENPSALDQLVHLCGESVWIAEQISRYPALLDELLDARTLYTPTDRESIAQDLRQHVLHVPSDDLEMQMEALRYFRRAHTLRIAACEVEGALSLMNASDNLTWLAEVILEHVLDLAWDWMVQRHGHPGHGEEDPEPGMLVLGYGKLGGIELGHGSDLDLVFVHNADPNLSSDGERSIDNATFFVRLGQRMVHILTTQTVSGALYEVDMRLRPNGNAGMLVSSLPSFEKYQRQEAWTWEHQALVRARPVAGNGELGKAFLNLRREVLCERRDPGELRDDVLAMREKMRTHLGSGDKAARAGEFQLKQDAGGIVDIEFMVQFAVLARAREFPELTRWTDNMRILDSLEEKDILAPDEARGLREAYIAYRSATHRLQLQRQPGVVQGEAFAPHRQAVTAVWQRLLGD